MNFIGENFFKKLSGLFNKKERLTAKLHKNLKSFFLRKEKVEFIPVNEPDISIILVLYNQAQYTLECLCLLQQQRNISFEIIIIDNASSDSTHKLLDRCQNILVVKNSENVGFLDAANQGAQIARGKNLLFLNNDIWYLNNDALAIALNTLNMNQQIGAVGGRVILPHGYLQEAGVYITQQGIQQYGRDKSPTVFDVMFQRHVDYCSGLFLLTPKHLFQSLGGFDRLYVPAYYEDSDYCLRLNYQGFKVIYDPRIIIGHIEGGSEVKKGNARHLYEKNTILFRNKHKEWIQSFAHLSDGADSISSDVLISRSHKRHGKRILFIGKSIPSQETLDLMKTACDSDQVVSYYPLKKLSGSWEEIYTIFDIRIEVCKGLKLSNLDNFMNLRRGYYSQIIDDRGDNTKWLKYCQLLDTR